MVRVGGYRWVELPRRLVTGFTPDFHDLLYAVHIKVPYDLGSELCLMFLKATTSLIYRVEKDCVVHRTPIPREMKVGVVQALNYAHL
jgi:hypothetical protein